MTVVLENQAALHNFLSAQNSKKLALVPTMGNLHAGHIQLMQIAKQHADCVVASIFVNPTQFAANEDLDRYPRTFQADLEKLRAAGVDAVFFPDVATMYPEGIDETFLVTPPADLSQILCGQARPTHFQGVATVVLKLFLLIRPDIAVFGEKDFQQLAVIRQLNKAFFTNIEIIGAPIVREPSGLALSSRNQYLSETGKQTAALIFQQLSASKTRLLAGEQAQKVLLDAKQTLTKAGFLVDYFELANRHSLKAQTQPQDGILLAAARIENTRLIDNLLI